MDGVESRMAALDDVVADLVAKTRAAASAPTRTLAEVTDFGDDPGSLRMLMHAPDGVGPGAPLVVVLHGCGQTAAGYAEAAGWIALSERYGFVVLCPEQRRSNNANGCFNWFSRDDVARGGGEAASIAAMVRHAVARHALDRSRVFVTGLSAGGAMAGVMLATYPELFAAGAIVAGLPFGAAEGMQEAFAAMRRAPVRSARAWGEMVRQAAPEPARRPRVAIWHGDGDTTVSPTAADALVLQWTELHGVDRAEQRSTASQRHRHTVWRGPDGEILVEAHRIAGLGHGTPIAAGGPDGCGTAAPWVLEAGVSSSLEIARFCGITERRRAADDDAGKNQAASGLGARRPSPAKVGGVADVISKALKQAGLLR